jgi:amino acid adenylation domain-containing protein
LNIFFRELSSFYNAFCCGRPPMPAEQPGRYIDFALAEQEFVGAAEFEAQLSYWKRQLADSSPTLNLPVKARPAIRVDAAASVSVQVAKDLEERIDEFCRQEKCTRFVFLLAVFATLLARFTDDHDLSIGTIVSARDRKAWEQIFGFITNTVVLRLKNLDGGASFRQLLRQVKEILVEAHQNKDLPFEHLVRALPSVRSNAHAPLFQAIVFLQNTYEEHFAFNDIQAEFIPVNNPVTSFDLSLALEQSAKGLKIALQYKTDVLKDGTAARLISDYGKVLEWVLQWPDQKISAISLLTEQELQQLTLWNGTAGTCLPPPQYVHKLFEQQVTITPEAIAISCAGHNLTYRALNERANQLARHLQHLGVGPENFVGICMEPGLDSIGALLAVLKAGSGYVPLDPAHPVQRLQFMAKDAAFPVLLTQRKFAGTLTHKGLAEIQLDRDWQSIATYDSHDLDIQLDPGTPAYLIYTSGTTGAPKGVIVSHSALSNQLLWLKSEFPLARTDRVLQRTALSFDAAAGEIFLPLLTGAQLIIAEPGQPQDVDYLLDLIVKERITLADVPPSLLMALLQRPAAKSCSSLRWVMCGGEMFPLELRERFSRTLNAAIYNLYGPTETTIQSTFHRCSAAETYGCVPIGQPIANTQV